MLSGLGLSCTAFSYLVCVWLQAFFGDKVSQVGEFSVLEFKLQFVLLDSFFSASTQKPLYVSFVIRISLFISVTNPIYNHVITYIKQT